MFAGGGPSPIPTASTAPVSTATVPTLTPMIPTLPKATTTSGSSSGSSGGGGNGESGGGGGGSPTYALAGTFIADFEADAAVDPNAYLRYLTDSASRWAHFLSTAGKADDKRAQTASGARSGGGSLSDSAELENKAYPVPPPFLPVAYRRSFSVATVACALTDLWPHLMRVSKVVLKLQERDTGSSAGGGGSGGGSGTPPVSAPASKRVSGLFSTLSFSTASAPLAALTASHSGQESIAAAKLGPCSPSENEVRLAAIDTLKYALSAALFIGAGPLIREGAEALLQVEAGTLGLVVARESKSSPEGWYAIVQAFAAGRSGDAYGGVDSTGVAEAISVLHVAVAEMREEATSKSEAASVEKVAERFRGVIAKELASDTRNRRLLYEGDLTKVAGSGRGKHTIYRFFLFNDMIVYASQGVFSGGKYAVHQKIPLAKMKVVGEVPELAAVGVHHAFKLENSVKALVVFAASEADSRAWRRHINEAIATLNAEEYSGGASIGTKESNRRGSVLNTFRRDSEIGMKSSASAGKLIGADSSGSGTPAPDGKKPPLPPTRAPSAHSLPVAYHHDAVGLVHSDSDSEAPPTATSGSANSGGASGGVSKAKSTGVGPSVLPAVGAPATPGFKATTTVAAAAASGSSPESGGSVSTRGSLLGVSASTPISAARLKTFESIAELKNAFLHAVAFCRPLLSSDATHAVPSGSRVAGSMASPSATLALSDADKLAFYAYFKQATHGDCPEPSGEDDVTMMGVHTEASSGTTSSASSGDASSHLTTAQLTITKAKRDAWRRCTAMRRRDAMRAFVLLLDHAVPAWDTTAAAAAISAATGKAEAAPTP